MSRTSTAFTPRPPLSMADQDLGIEILRGIAAWLVMAVHYAHMLTAYPGLWGFASTGVDLFFVLSGYVFAPYLFGKPLRMAPHLIRRFFRLYPLYLCALLLYAGLRLPAATAWDYLGVHLVLGHTLSSMEVANFYNPAFWSLPPEVEYYLLLPLLAWAATRLRFVWILVLAAAMHLLLVAAASPAEQGISARAIATVHVPGLLIEFMLGSWAYALAQREAGGREALLRLGLGLLVLTGMGTIYASYIASYNGTVRTVPTWIGGNIGLGAAFGYALVVSVVASPQCQAVVRCTPWLVFMGQLSYGVYLFHNAAPQILARILPAVSGGAAVLLCVVITLLMAFVAHHAIETPMRNLGRRLGQAVTK